MNSTARSDNSNFESVKEESPLKNEDRSVKRESKLDKVLFYDSASKDSGYGANEPEKSILEEDFWEIDNIKENEESNLPEDFSKLISGPLFVEECSKEEKEEQNFASAKVQNHTLRRCSSLQFTNTRSLKRSEPELKSESPCNIKKIKLFDSTGKVGRKQPFERFFSVTEEAIKLAVYRSTTQDDLIGDFSKTYSLPLIKGRHSDLSSVNPSTVADLINGNFHQNVESFKIIDCRYPYEYEGGHIIGAVNIYMQQSCVELLKNPEVNNKSQDNKRKILIFHCEFSSLRAPSLYRLLRKKDRQLNQQFYPNLYYPEIYLLEGGYKAFFEKYSSLCEPSEYKEMLHPGHTDDLKYFRQKSKSEPASRR